MALHFLCPFGHKLMVPDHRAGKKGRCPVCYQRVIVPVPNPEPSGKSKKDSDAPDDLLQAATGPQQAPQGGLGFFNAAGQQMPMQQIQPMVPTPPGGQMPSMVPQQPMGAAYPYPAAQPGSMFEPIQQPQQQYPQQYQQPGYAPQPGYPQPGYPQPGYPQPGQPYRPQ
jgi:hypothetical protein